MTAIVVAVISALGAVLAAVVSVISAGRAQRRADEAKQTNDRALAEFQNLLSERTAERDARRDYDYEARKRLYAVTEPLLFQLMERAEELKARIANMARAARDGHLGSGAESWWRDEYYLRSTMHRLLGPVAIFQLLQDSLTHVDLVLDKEVRAQYEIARCLAWSLTDPHTLARFDPPEIAHGEGLTSGDVETAGQALLAHPNQDRVRVMRFGEFDQAYSDQASQVSRAFRPVAGLFAGFHPSDRPVLWRILIAQALLCDISVTFRNRSDAGEGKFDLSQVVSGCLVDKEDQKKFSWCDSGTDADEVSKQFEIARRYVLDNLGERFTPSISDK